MLCSAPAIFRVELTDGGQHVENDTAVPLNFSENVMYEPDPAVRIPRLASPPLTYDFFAYGLYSVHIVKCRAGDTGNQAADQATESSSELVRHDDFTIPVSTISGRLAIATEAPTVFPDLLPPTPYEQRISRASPSSKTARLRPRLTRRNLLPFCLARAFGEPVPPGRLGFGCQGYAHAGTGACFAARPH